MYGIRYWPLGASFLLAATAVAAQTASGTLPVQIVKEKRTISTATRSDEDPLRVPFASTLVTREQMDDVGAVTLDDALRTVPGLQHGTQGNYFTRFETRGLRDTQDVLVLIDGVPLRLLQGNADVTLIPTSLLERVEFIKGPASALYGKNAIGGVAQFFLRPEHAGGSASLTLGSFGRVDQSLRHRWDLDRGHIHIGLSHSDYDGFQRHAGRGQKAVVVGGDFAVTRSWTTGVQLLDSSVHADRGSIVPLANGQPMFGITSRDNYAIAGSFINGDYQSLAWKNRFDFGAGWRLNHLSSFSQYDRMFAAGITIVPPPAAVNKGYTETQTDDRGGFHELSMSWLTAGKDWSNELQAGFSLEKGWQDQASAAFSNAPTYRGPNYNTPVSNVGNDPRGIRGAVTGSRFDQDVKSLYVQNRFEWLNYGLTAGWRHDKFEQSLTRSNSSVRSLQSASRTSPRIGVDWLFAQSDHSSHAAFGNWTEGFRPQAVAWNTRNGVVVPDILRPEVTRSKELGVKGQSAHQDWAYQVSLFQSDKIDGQRAYRNGPDSFVFSNATSRVSGLESQVQWRLSPQWRGFAHYTRQDARLRDFQTYTNAGLPSTNFGGYRMRMSAKHIAGAGVAWKQGPWAATANANYVSSRMLRDNLINPQKLPGYLLLNVALNYQVNRQLTLQAGINNLADQYYISDDLSSQEAGNAGAPRTVFVRATYAFQ